MQVFVKTLSGQTVTVDCEPSDTVFEFKQKLAIKIKTLPSAQRAIFEGHYLQDEQGLEQSQIKTGSIVFVTPKQGGGMQVQIKTLTGKTYDVDCEPSDTFADIKQRICETEGIPVDQQRMISKGRCCIDEVTLKDFGIVKGDTIHLVLRLRPGG